MYQVVDTIFVGRSIGPVAIAALGVTLPIHMIITAIALMFGVGSASIVSRKLGASEHNDAALAVGNALIATLISVILIATTFLFFLDPLLRGFGASETVLPYARNYLGILLIGSPFAATISCSNAIIRSEGRAKVSMAVILIGNGINIVLDALFISILEWGVRGAALATVIGQVVGTLYIIRHFTTHRTSIRFTRQSVTFSWSIVFAIVVLGFPTIVRQAGTSLMMLSVNTQLGKYSGDLAIATYGLIGVLAMFLNMPISGLSQGFQPIVGYNHGAQKADRVLSVLKKSMFATTLMGILFMLTIVIIPNVMVSLFTSDTQLLETATYAIRIVLATVPLIGIQTIGASYFQSVGKAVPSLTLWMTRQFLFMIPLVLFLPGFLGVQGVWLAFPITDCLSTLVTILWVRYEIRTTLRLSRTASAVIVKDIC
jgi:putative MATE family efflux protein